MQILILNGWELFCIAFAIVLLTSFVMGLLAKNFYTFKNTRHKFSIMELQFPASNTEIATLINGIYLLPQNEADKAVRALKAQLWVDFLFMPAAYGAIFLLCMQFSWKMPTYGTNFFCVVAWLQVIPWCCDITENIFLLSQVKNNSRPLKKSFFIFYKWMVITKWGVALFGLVCALSAALYFWLSGHYTPSSLYYLAIILAETVLILVLMFIVSKVLNAKLQSATP